MSRAALAARFESHVDRSGGPDACHPWTGALSVNGYGRFRVGARSEYAHRVALDLARRPLSPGRQADHRCHNDDDSCLGGNDCPHRRCVNPRHLRSATRLANVRAGRSGQHMTRRSAARTHCKNGHRLTERNTAIVAGRRRCRPCDRIAYRERKGPAQEVRGPLRRVVARADGRDRLECRHVLPAPREERLFRRCPACDRA